METDIKNVQVGSFELPGIKSYNLVHSMVDFTTVVSILNIYEFNLHSMSNRLGNLYLSKFEIFKIARYFKEEQLQSSVEPLLGSSLVSRSFCGLQQSGLRKIRANGGGTVSRLVWVFLGAQCKQFSQQKGKEEQCVKSIPYCKLSTRIQISPNYIPKSQSQMRLRD